MSLLEDIAHSNLLENTEPVIILDFNRKLQEFPSLSLPVSYLAPRWSTAGPSAPPSRAASAASPRRVGSAAGPSAPSSRAAMGARPARPPHPRWERRRAAGPCAPSSPAALGARATGPSASTPPLRAVLGEQATGLSASSFPCAGSSGQDARRTAASLRGARKNSAA